jgi:hypothetical protein
LTKKVVGVQASFQCRLEDPLHVMVVMVVLCTLTVLIQC